MINILGLATAKAAQELRSQTTLFAQGLYPLKWQQLISLMYSLYVKQLGQSDQTRPLRDLVPWTLVALLGLLATFFDAANLCYDRPDFDLGLESDNKLTIVVGKPN